MNELRVAIMWNGQSIKLWQKNALEQLFSVEKVIPVLLIRPVSDSVPSGKPSFFYRVFRKVTDPELMKNAPLPSSLNQVKSISCKTEPVGRFREKFLPEDIRIIKESKPDVIIRFGFSILTGEILTCAPYGVWSYHHGDPLSFRGGPPLFWEFYYNKPIAGAILQQLTERLDAGLTLRSGKFKINRHSFRESFSEVLETSASWLKLAALETLENPERELHAIVSNAPLTTYPKNGAALKVLLKLGPARLKFYWQKYFLSEDWAIARLDQPIADLIAGKPLAEPDWHQAKKRSSYLADPFPFHYKGTTYFACEEYSYLTGKGKIISDRLLSPGNPAPVINEADDCHRSYPYTFEFEGETYMVSESAASNITSLYRFSDSGWKKAYDLITDFPAVDPSLIFYKNKWWLFCTKGSGKASNRDLYLFHSSSLDEPFRPHLLNPVKNNVSNARPGGSMLIMGDRLYRMAQDSSNGYGTRVHIMEIEEISPTRFNEKIIRSIEPFKNTPYKSGIHTISGNGNYTLADGKRLIFRFSALFLNLRKIFRNK